MEIKSLKTKVREKPIPENLNAEALEALVEEDKCDQGETELSPEEQLQALKKEDASLKEHANALAEACDCTSPNSAKLKEGNGAALWGTHCRTRITVDP